MANNVSNTSNVNDFISAIGAVGSLFGPAQARNGVQLSYRTQKKLMQDQAKINYQYYEKELQNRWLLARQGLVNGDFNPMLAGIGNISGNSSWASPQTTSELNFGSTANGAISNALDTQRVSNETDLKNAQVDNQNADTVLKEQQAISEEQHRIESDARTKLAQANTVLSNKQSDNFEREQAREDKKVAIQLLDVNNRYTIAREQNQIAKMRAQTERYNADTQHQQLLINDYNAVTNRFTDNSDFKVNVGPIGVSGSSRSFNGGIPRNQRTYRYYRSPLGNYYGY